MLTPRALVESESDARLTHLINEYRDENERCTRKINMLKQKIKDYREIDSNNIVITN